MPQSEMKDAFVEHRVIDSCPDCGDLFYEHEGHECPSTVEPQGSAGGEITLATPVPIFGQMAPLAAAGELGTRDEVQDELDAIVGAIRMFHIKQPDQVMRECSAYGARLTELAVLLHRVESLNRQYQRIRTMQVQKIIDEIDRQFRTASRLVEIQRQDLELMR